MAVHQNRSDRCATADLPEVEQLLRQQTGRNEISAGEVADCYRDMMSQDSNGQDLVTFEAYVEWLYDKWTVEVPVCTVSRFTCLELAVSILSLPLFLNLPRILCFTSLALAISVFGTLTPCVSLSLLCICFVVINLALAVFCYPMSSLGSRSGSVLTLAANRRI